MLKWILGFLLGTSSIYGLSELLSRMQLILLSVAAILLLLLSLAKFRYWIAKRWLRTLMVITSGVLLGLCWVSIEAENHLEQRFIPQGNSPVRSQLTQQAHIIEAKLVSIPVIYQQYMQFIVSAKIPQHGQDVIQLKLKWYSYQDFQQDLPKLGETWRFKIKLKPIYSAINTAGFDGEKYALAQNIAANGSIQKGSVQRFSSAANYSLANIRQQLFERLNNYQSRGVLQALLIGEKQHISKSQRQLISTLGVNHLLAISGLHIAIVAGFCLFVGQWIWGLLPLLRDRVSPLAAGMVLSLFAALAYSALAGFSLPTVRALIMWCGVLFGYACYQKISLAQSLAIALLIILIWQPLSVLSASFWLTFVAVAVIGLLLMGRKSAGKNSLVEKKQTNSFWLMVKLQLPISLAMMLMALMFFQQASLIMLLANLILIPVFSLLLLPALFVALLFDLLVGWDFGLQLFDELFSHFFVIESWLNPEVWMLSQHIEPWVFLFLIVIYGLFVIPLGTLRYLPLAGLLVLVVSFSANKTPQEKFKLVVFDVGHGMANLIYNDNFAVLYDTGFGNENLSATELYLVPSLRALGIKQLDLVVVSHRDNDHAGGLEYLQSQMPINELITQDNCRREQNWSFGDLSLEVLYADEKSEYTKTNNQSCVIKVNYRTQQLLLVGDIEKAVEYQLAREQRQQLKADLLIAPHHGSNTSSTYPFIKAVSPELVIYSTDRFNRYGMPHPKVVKRYTEFGVKQITVGCSGQLTIDLETLTVKALRQTDRKVWRNRGCD